MFRGALSLEPEVVIVYNSLIGGIALIVVGDSKFRIFNASLWSSEKLEKDPSMSLRSHCGIDIVC